LNENFQNVFFEIELGKFRKTHSENLGGEKERNFLRIHILDPVFCWGIKVQPGWMKCPGDEVKNLRNFKEMISTF
jgi:hypothetical protein